MNDQAIGDLSSNRQMYDEIPKLPIGGAAGPFRVSEGLQVVALCSKEGSNGLPTRDSVSQQLLLQKLEAAGPRLGHPHSSTVTARVRLNRGTPA